VSQTGQAAEAAAFTLVEVLVSLGIFALAAVALSTAYVNVLTTYHAMRARAGSADEIAFVRAALLAEPARDRAEQGGQLSLPAGGTLRWRAEIDEAFRADLFRVTLEFEILPRGQSPSRRERQSFLLLRPTWSDPARREKLRDAFRARLAERPA